MINQYYDEPDFLQHVFIHLIEVVKISRRKYKIVCCKTPIVLSRKKSKEFNTRINNYEYVKEYFCSFPLIHLLDYIPPNNLNTSPKWVTRYKVIKNTLIKRKLKN